MNKEKTFGIGEHVTARWVYTMDGKPPRAAEKSDSFVEASGVITKIDGQEVTIGSGSNAVVVKKGWII